jgi:hypothetical protein
VREYARRRAGQRRQAVLRRRSPLLGRCRPARRVGPAR